jgi:hypothetical protein
VGEVRRWDFAGLVGGVLVRTVGLIGEGELLVVSLMRKDIGKRTHYLSVNGSISELGSGYILLEC